MIKRIFSSKSKTITGAAILLGLASFISRLIGILRDRIFAHEFGAGESLDIYYAAFKIPDLVYNLIIIGALSAGFIPVFAEVMGKSKKEAWQVTNSVINIFGVLLVIVCGILWIFTPQIIPFIVPGFSKAAQAETISLTRIMFLSPVLLGLSGIVSSVLQACKSFMIYSLTPIMYNMGIIFGAVILVPTFGIKGLAYGVVFGAFLHLAVQLTTFYKHGFTYEPIFLTQNKHVRTIFKLMIPRTLGLASNQLMLFAMVIIASELSSGSLTIFNFANNLQYFPIGIIGYSFAIAAFPTLAEFAARKNYEKLTHHLTVTVRQILFLIVPLTVIFLLLRAQIVRVVLGTGQFDWPATITTGDTLALFSLSLFAQCLIPLLARTFYALQDTWTPFTIALISSLTTILLSLLLKDPLGVPGLALAFSIASVIQLALLWFLLRMQKLDSLNELAIMHSLFKISIAAIIMAIIVQSLKAPLASLVDMTRFWGIFTQGFVSGTAGLLAYLTICYMLKLEEVTILAKSFGKKWLNLSTVQGEINEADEV